jgi:hypothetical protein
VETDKAGRSSDQNRIARHDMGWFK